MIYVCGKCRFAFERVGEPERCPDCGALAIHEANDHEQQEYRRTQEELHREQEIPSAV